MNKIANIAKLLEDMESGIYDFTVNGQCSNYGSCCSNFLPISEEEINKIRRFIKSNNVKEMKHIIPTATPTLDMTCPFRNDAERICTIYPVRPQICKDFRCDKPKKKIQAGKRMYHGQYRVVDMRKEFFEIGRR